MKGRKRWGPLLVLLILWVSAGLWQDADDLVPFLVGSALAGWMVAVAPSSWEEESP